MGAGQAVKDLGSTNRYLALTAGSELHLDVFAICFDCLNNFPPAYRPPDVNLKMDAAGNRVDSGKGILAAEITLKELQSNIYHRLGRTIGNSRQLQLTGKRTNW